MREWSRYRSVYCGICVQIGRTYGQLPRLAVNYDMTLLALLLLSLSEEQPLEKASGCILNPFLHKPIVQGGTILDLCAGLTVLLAWYQSADRLQDEHKLAGAAARMALWRSYRKAKRLWPDYDGMISRAMAEIARAEQGPPDPAAAALFGSMLQDIAYLATESLTLPEPVRQAVGLLGHDLGRWVYLIDAIDDWRSDLHNGCWNPYGQLDEETARDQAGRDLDALEASMDRTAALLPYQRDAGLMANVFISGLPDMRRQIMSGRKQKRL